MMQCTVTGQLLQCQKKIIIEKSVNYLIASFTFDNDWDGLIKLAQFVREDKFLQLVLEDDRCVVPWEMLQTDGSFLMTVLGVNREGEDAKVITCNGVVIKVYRSGLVEDQTPDDPTPVLDETILAQCIAAKEAAEAAAQSASESATVAGNSRDEAGASAEGARASAAAAVSAKSEAVQAKDTAVSAGADAVSAKSEAVSAKDTAVASREAAEAARNDAQAYKEAAEQAAEVLENTPHLAYDDDGDTIVDYGEDADG